MPVLRVRKGKNEGEAFAVFSHKEPTVLGRGKDNGVSLDDNRCSRKHARILLVSGNWLIEDLDSSNGTLVNGEKIDKGPLPDKASIQIGNTLLDFEETKNLLPPRREIYGCRLLDTTREEGGVFVYIAHQAALDRLVRIDLFAESQAPTGELLDKILSAVKTASNLKHDLIDGIVTSEFSDSGKSYLLHRSRDGTSLEAELASLLEEPIEARLDLVRQLLTITRARCEISEICLPINLTQLQIHPGAGSSRSLSVSALELPTLVSLHNGALCELPSYKDYLPPELCEAGNGADKAGEKALAYSAAALSYHLLTGAPVMGTGEMKEILEKHRDLKPAPANLINPDIPDDLSDLLNGMLEKDPAERPSAAESLDPVIASIESITESHVEIEESRDEPGPAGQPPAAPTPAIAETKPVITTPRFESGSGGGSSQLKNLVSLPFWAALWAALFYGSSKVAEILFDKANQ